MPRVVMLLAESARHADGQALPVCCAMLRLLITWCHGCSAAVKVLLSNPAHLPLLVDLVGRRTAAGDAHTAGGCVEGGSLSQRVWGVVSGSKEAGV